jgi:hypothetical protein
MKPSSQGSRSARSSECAVAGLEFGPAAGSEIAARAATAALNKLKNREMEKSRGRGRDICIPLKLRWPNPMFTLREIFYNEKLRVGCVYRGSPPGGLKTSSAPQNLCRAAQICAARPQYANNEIQFGAQNNRLAL